MIKISNEEQGLTSQFNCIFFIEDNKLYQVPFKMEKFYYHNGLHTDFFKCAFKYLTEHHSYLEGQGKTLAAWEMACNMLSYMYELLGSPQPPYKFKSYAGDKKKFSNEVPVPAPKEEEELDRFTIVIPKEAEEKKYAF